MILVSLWRGRLRRLLVCSLSLCVGLCLNHSVSGTAFSADDGATLLMAFRGLQAETAQQGGVHQAIARELHQLVADPFEKWAKDYHVGHIDFVPPPIVIRWLL